MVLERRGPDFPDSYPRVRGIRERLREPTSASRLGLFIATVAVIVALVFVDALAVETAAPVLVGAFMLLSYVERSIENKARRDLTTDLCQAIHDGEVDAETLRRSRGYIEIERALWRDRQ